MASILQGDATYQVLNLMHARPRHWRELILWINLHGYPVSLVESEDWIRHLFAHGHGRDTMLYAQRRFFSGGLADDGVWAKPYEAYLADSQRQIDTTRTRALLKSQGVSEAPLDADLLHAYFDYYRSTGVVPQRTIGDMDSQSLDELWHGNWHTTGAGIGRWETVVATRIGSDDGLLSEIATGVGRWLLESTEAGGPVKAVLKAKVSDQVLTDLTVRLADVCSTELGTMFARFSDALGRVNSHERELAIYELDEPLLRRNMPTCYGTLRNVAAGRWAVIQEYLPDAEAGWSDRPANGACIDVILSGLAEIHAVGYPRRDVLSGRLGGLQCRMQNGFGHIVDGYRVQLSRVSLMHFDSDEWREGFAYAFSCWWPLFPRTLGRV